MKQKSSLQTWEAVAHYCDRRVFSVSEALEGSWRRCKTLLQVDKCDGGRIDGAIDGVYEVQRLEFCIGTDVQDESGQGASAKANVVDVHRQHRFNDADQLNIARGNFRGRGDSISRRARIFSPGTLC